MTQLVLIAIEINWRGSFILKLVCDRKLIVQITKISSLGCLTVLMDVYQRNHHVPHKPSGLTYTIMCHIHHHVSHTSSCVTYIIMCHIHHHVSHIHHHVSHKPSCITCIIMCHIHHHVSHTSSVVTYIIMCHIHHQLSHTSSVVTYIIKCQQIPYTKTINLSTLRCGKISALACTAFLVLESRMQSKTDSWLSINDDHRLIANT